MAASNKDHLLKHATDRWNELNARLEHVPKFQNQNQPGVSDERIQEVEQKFKMTLPTEVRAFIKVHDGRKHIGYGLSYRLPTTDLLPISEWKPYETNDEYGFANDLFTCLTDQNDACADKNLREDAREHLHAYIEGEKKAEEQNEKHQLSDNKAFQSLPCELLIIGQGMDDYSEEYLLSTRSGRIYLAVHNIPEWRLIGTFADWIQEGLTNAKEQHQDLKEQHEDV